ncbi:MAG: flavodoxin family protein [Pirellulaceae bacterium]|nr:flavodoxin family protein [Pirellulaceae bacterium]
MARNLSRRRFLRAGAAVAATTVAVTAANTSLAQGDQEPRKLKIIAVACSPRAGKTTAQALQVCLEAAKAVDPERIEVELIELAGLKIPAHVAVGLPLEPGEKDDFPAVAEKLGAANVAGIIIGSPVYFCNMSALCKAFLDRCFSFRARKFALANKVAAVVAVGGVRNGGQEYSGCADVPGDAGRWRWPADGPHGRDALEQRQGRHQRRRIRSGHGQKLGPPRGRSGAEPGQLIACV